MMHLRDVRVPWRTLQIIINICTIVTSFCTFLPLGYVSSYFSWNCVLYTDIVLTDQVNSTAIYVDKEQTVWGSRSTCYFSTYAPLMAGIHAFIWCWYFLLMKEQLKADHQEFALLVFSFLLHSIVCIVIFVSSSTTSAGIDAWCHNLVKALKDKGQSVTCRQIQKMDWPNIYTDGKKHFIYSFLLIAKISGWIQTLAVLSQCVVCGYKLYRWFLKTTHGHLDLKNCRLTSSSGELFQINDGYERSDGNITVLHSVENDGYNRLQEEEEEES